MTFLEAIGVDWYGIRKDTGAIGSLCHIKKVNGHLGIGPVKKLEIIY